MKAATEAATSSDGGREETRLREQVAALEAEVAAAGAMAAAPHAASVTDEAVGAVELGSGSTFALLSRLMSCTPSKSGYHSALRTAPQPDETYDGVANQLSFESPVKAARDGVG